MFDMWCCLCFCHEICALLVRFLCANDSSRRSCGRSLNVRLHVPTCYAGSYSGSGFSGSLRSAALLFVVSDNRILFNVFISHLFSSLLKHVLRSNGADLLQPHILRDWWLHDVAPCNAVFTTNTSLSETWKIVVYIFKRSNLLMYTV
jgi:hypothetical protein